MTATRRGLVRGALAVAAAPAAAVAAPPAVRTIHIDRDWANYVERWNALRAWESRLATHRRLLNVFSRNLQSGAVVHRQRRRDLRRFEADLDGRERMLDLRERFLDTWPRWLDWSEVSDWGGALAAMEEADD